MSSLSGICSYINEPHDLDLKDSEVNAACKELYLESVSNNYQLNAFVYFFSKTLEVCALDLKVKIASKGMGPVWVLKGTVPVVCCSAYI